MSEGRCGADIGQIREAHPTGELEWLDTFDATCSEDAGHEGMHVFHSKQGDDEQQLHWDSEAKRFSAYQGSPAAPHEVISF